MYKKLFLFLAMLLAFACKTLYKPMAEKKEPVTVMQFLKQPFVEKETVESLRKHFHHEVKIKRMLRRNKQDAGKVDTIFQFHSRKSEVFVYKTCYNRELLLGGVIEDDKFPLTNGIVPGINRNAFFKSFKDLNPIQLDSINLYSKELMRKFVFIFDTKGILKKISFSSNSE